MNHPYSKIKQYYKVLIPELEEESWELMASMFTIRRLKKGEVVFNTGDYCRNVSYLNHGLCRFYYSIEGKEVVAGFFREGEYLSEYSSFLLQVPSTMTADALEDTELIELSYDSIQKLYQKTPVFQKFGRLIAERLFIAVAERSHAFLLKTPEQRYHDFVNNSSLLVQRVPQYMIASYLGVTPEALSRIRKRISSQGS
jgi:CRP-like cAMP-binding protein